MSGKSTKIVYVDPSYKAYYENRLFDHNNLALNRDDTLTPFIRLRNSLIQKGFFINTADQLFQQITQEQSCDYYSMGMLENYEQLKTRKNVSLKAFIIFEPPVVAPNLYRALSDLTSAFEHVYVHNIEGDGYSLEGVNQSRLRKLYWPQPHKDVLLKFWNRKDRLSRIVMINGNHKPASYDGELYSKRIEVLSELSAFGRVDLYGRGWEKWWSRSSMWLPYWKHRRKLMSIYKGPCISKYEVLSNYSFALCFENMAMRGYVTEKIFDCLYAGTIPLYLGASDILDLLPEHAYIDCRKFSSWDAMHTKIMDMNDREILSMRLAGRAFIQSEKGKNYYNSLLSIFNNVSN